MRVAIALHDYSLCHRFAPLGRKLRKDGVEVKTFCAKPPAPREKILEGFEPHVEDWTAFSWSGIKAFNPDKVLVWNGNYPHITAGCHFLHEHYGIYVMEQGWLPQRGHSYIMKNDLAQVSLLPGSGSLCTTDLKKHQHVLEEARASYPTCCQRPKELPERFVFVPLQLEHDTQIVCTSHVFKTMNSLLGWAVNTCGTDLPVVFKDHPLFKGGENTPRPQGAIRYSGPLSSIDLARMSEFVIGINSTLLAEAMLFRKPVVGFGQHVCQEAFVNARLDYEDMSFDNIKKEMSRPTLNDEMDLRCLILLMNQFKTAEPPNWVVQYLKSDNMVARLPK